MKKGFSFSQLSVGVLAFGFLSVLSGCTDSDFDLSKVDTTIGIGGDALQLPTSDTEEIKLDDVLQLDNSDLVSVADNGDYMFRKEGDGMTPSHPHVDAVTIKVEDIDNDFRVEVPSSALSQAARKAARRAGTTADVSVEGKTSEFCFQGAVPNSIRAVSHADVEARMTVKVSVTDELKHAVSEFKTITLSFPSYMKLDIRQSSPSQPDYDEQSGVVTFHNVKSTADINLNATLVQLDFTKKMLDGSRLTLMPGEGGADGMVKVTGTALMGASFDKTAIHGTASHNLYLSSRLDMDAIRVRKVTGKFDPEITLHDLGDVAIGKVPDFLSGDDVSVDLYNPVVELNVNNSMDVAGMVAGTLIAEDENGTVTARVDIPQMRIKPEGATKICICKRADGMDASRYDEVKVVERLSDVMRTIPKTIRFVSDAKADAAREGTVELGKAYEITSGYSISAPLAFGERAQIAYSDTLDGWNDDLEDIELADGAYVEMTADVDNKIPAYLTVKAFAIDVDGKEVPQSKVSVDVDGVVKASEDGAAAVTSPITIRLHEEEKGSLKTIDGIAFRVVAASGNEGGKSIVGKTINAYKHTLTARNIKVKLVGRVVADLN